VTAKLLGLGVLSHPVSQAENATLEVFVKGLTVAVARAVALSASAEVKGEHPTRAGFSTSSSCRTNKISSAAEGQIAGQRLLEHLQELRRELIQHGFNDFLLAAKVGVERAAV